MKVQIFSQKAFCFSKCGIEHKNVKNYKARKCNKYYIYGGKQCTRFPVPSKKVGELKAI